MKEEEIIKKVFYGDKHFKSSTLEDIIKGVNEMIKLGINKDDAIRVTEIIVSCIRNEYGD